MKGLAWRVGNGLSINPWTDKWITGTGVARGLSNDAADDNLLRVSDLIDFNQGCWKVDTITHVVDDAVRDAILSILDAY